MAASSKLRPCPRRSLTKLVASAEVKTSKTPSQPISRKSSPSRSFTEVRSGTQDTRSPRAPPLKAKSPSARDTAIWPFTRLLATKPPPARDDARSRRAGRLYNRSSSSRSHPSGRARLYSRRARRSDGTCLVRRRAPRARWSPTRRGPWNRPRAFFSVRRRRPGRPASMRRPSCPANSLQFLGEELRGPLRDLAAAVPIKNDDKLRSSRLFGGHVERFYQHDVLH